MTPVSAEEFAALMARFAPWPQGRPVGVAVSGGADSLCLAWLAHHWGQARGLIIDHGLRPESAAEAALTVARLASFGMASDVHAIALTPGPGLAARARTARYDALACMAAAHGIVDLLVGHHALDQAETALMRVQARSGPAGLAAMAALHETQAVRIVRPLLGLPPGRLRATLREAGLAWVEDPSNSNPKALRIRLRQGLADPDGGGEATALLVESARRQGAARAVAEQEAAAILAERVAIHPQGFAILSPGPIAPAPLAALLRTLSGAPYAPSAAAVADLARHPRPATLAGVQLLPAGRLGPGLLLVREAAAMAGPIPAQPGALWDRRFILCDGAGVKPGTMLGAIGADASSLRRIGLPAAVVRTMPALRRDGIMIDAAPAVLFRPAGPLAGGAFFI
jgi:tRNA(Ile)-lysidine synthase